MNDVTTHHTTPQTEENSTEQLKTTTYSLLIMRNALRKLILLIQEVTQMPLRARVMVSRQLPRSLHQLCVPLQLAQTTQQVRRFARLLQLSLQLSVTPSHNTHHLDRLRLLAQDLQTVHTVLQQVQLLVQRQRRHDHTILEVVLC